MPRPTLPTRIQQLREDAHLSRAELAERSGLSVQLIGFIETGFRSAFQRDTLQRLGAALNADVVIDLVPREVTAAAERIATIVESESLERDDVDRLARIAAALSRAPAETKDAIVLALEGLAAVNRK